MKQEQEQEQKPFEIKEEFRDLSVDEIIRLCGECGDWDSMTVLHLIAYVKKSNAEIRRLQGQVLGFERDTTDWQLEVANLRQQLADASTWGEWQDVTIANLKKANSGIYEFQWGDEGDFECFVYSDAGFVDESGNLFDLTDISEISNDKSGVITRLKQFRRLNYEPQPAREVELTYWHNGKKYTLQEMTGVFGVAGVLASELLAAQRELAELKGKR